MESFIRAQMSPNEFPRTHQVITDALLGQVAPGFAVGVWRKKFPHQIEIGSWGNRRRVPTPLPLFDDTVFDLASLTKVLATAPLAALLVERGWLSWDTSVSSILPQFKSTEVQVGHLLSHTAGFAAWKPYWQVIRDQLAPSRKASQLEQIPVQIRQSLMRELVLAELPQEKPGTKAIYSDISFLILGFLLEELTGRPLDQAIQSWVWDPLGITDLFFRPGHQPSDTIAATEDCPWRERVLQGEVHDDNCWAMGGYGGHAGAFGTVEGVLQLIRGLVSDGLLSSRRLNEMWTPVSVPPGCERTLGWDTPAPEGSSVGSLFSRRSVGHLGFSGTSVWYDRDAELAITLLSNRVHPSREQNQMKGFRPIFHDAIRKDLSSLGSI